MRKVFRYPIESFTIEDNNPINLEVRFISDGNFGQTIINIPGPNDPIIEDAGTVNIGNGSTLRGQTIVCFSLLNNLYPPEDEVRIEYHLNGTLILQHSNQKVVESRPIIVLPLKFI